MMTHDEYIWHNCAGPCPCEDCAEYARLTSPPVPMAEEKAYHPAITLLGRNDLDLGVGAFDSVKWALEEHCKMGDQPVFQSAILYGSEDCPDRIEFFTDQEVLVDSVPVMIWKRAEDEP